jgi:hypothetical protein
VTYALSAAASDARSEAAGDAVPSSRPSDNADEAAPPAPEGLVGASESDVRQHGNVGASVFQSSQEPTSRRHRNYEREY